MQPDFGNRYRRAVLRQGEPDRVPLGDVSVDAVHRERLLGRPLRQPADEVEFWLRAGFDYVVAEAGIQTSAAIGETKTAVEARYAFFERGESERAWVEQRRAPIRSAADLESFPWPDPDRLDYSRFETYSDLLPSGMRIVGLLGKIFNSVWWLMGFQHFAESIVDSPDLVRRVFDRVAEIQLRVLDRMLEIDSVGAVFHADDLAYAEGLMIGREHLREYLFPSLEELCRRVHARGKLAIFHSDGKLDAVMTDLIDCGFDAVHPFEPKAMDIVRAKRLHGDRICVMGNIDLGYTLTRGTPEEVLAECRERIRELAPGGGYCLASSNSIPEYVPHENFLALLEAVREYGRYPIAGAAGAAGVAGTAVAPEPEPVAAESAIAAPESGDPRLAPIHRAILHGRADECGEAVRSATEAGVDAPEIFDAALVPAMAEVGRRMETGEYFIPDVLLAARAMNSATALLKPRLRESTFPRAAGTVVLGTVQGDLHDIGKNLVALMLEGRGFRVVDLGVDVPPAKFVETVKSAGADLVALSALLTTTMLGMGRVVEALEREGLRDRVGVIVGGAPVDESFAREIGADGFAPNAAAGTRLACRLLEERRAAP